MPMHNLLQVSRQASDTVSQHHLKLREHPLSTYALRGRGEGQRNAPFLRTIVLIGCVKSVREGEGVKNPETFAYVL